MRVLRVWRACCCCVIDCEVSSCTAVDNFDIVMISNTLVFLLRLSSKTTDSMKFLQASTTCSIATSLCTRFSQQLLLSTHALRKNSQQKTLISKKHFFLFALHHSTNKRAHQHYIGTAMRSSTTSPLFFYFTSFIILFVLHACDLHSQPVVSDDLVHC